MNILIVVDMQKDFIDGSLGTAEAQGIVGNVAEKIRSFDGKILVTLDTHTQEYLQTQEGKNLPVEHCIRGTEGWRLNDQIQDALGEREDCVIFEKPTFGSAELGAYLKNLGETSEEDIQSIELVGLCTDICVISNALLVKAFLPEVPVRVDASCCAGVTPESHENALRAMRMCQISVTGV